MRSMTYAERRHGGVALTWVQWPMQSIPQALADLIANAPMDEFAAGTTLIAADARAAPLWFLHDGLVRLYALAADGGSYNLGFHGGGEFVSGRLALRDGRVCCGEHALGVEALQATRASALSLLDIDRLRHDDAAVSAWLLDRLLEMNAARLGREADLAQRSATERYQELLRKRPTIIGQVPLHQIAAWLGITPVALSRIRRRLANSAL